MSLIVETGQGGADSESYISVAACLAYHAKMGNDQWATITTTQQEQALRRATTYMQIYRPRWKGVRTSQTQALDWPRYSVQLPDVGYGSVAAYVPWTVVPIEVQNACAELALRASAGPLAPDLKRTVKEKTIGPITTVYADGAPEYVRYREVDHMLAPYLAGSGTSGRMVRS